VKRLYLIDGTALAYRSHFAFTMSERGGLSTTKGRPTSAVYGFTMTMLALFDREKPDAVIVSFDGAVDRLERTRVFASYKSTRQKMPDELVGQLDLIDEMVRAFGIPVVRSTEHEADDVIGTLAVRGRDAGMDVYIVTSDKDFMQIVGPRIRLWNLRASTRAPEIIGPDEVALKFGIGPERMVDLLALMGDSSDNIPGVPKVGAKTAAQLLEQFGSLDEVLARAEEVSKPSIREALLSHREQALLSRALVTLRTDVPLDVDLAKVPPPQPQRDVLEKLFRELEFESLLKNLPPPPTPAIAQDYTIVRTEAQLDELLAALRRAGAFAFDLETTSLDPLRCKPVGFAFSMTPGEAAYVPLNAQPPVVAGGAAALLQRLRPLLEDEGLRKTVHNAKYAMSALRSAGVELRGVDFDTMLASYCLTPGVTSHDLGTLALRYFAHKKVETKEVIGTGKKQKTFGDVDVDTVGRYAAEDADLVGRVRQRLEPEIVQTGVVSVLRDIEMPLVPVLVAMEREGIRVDLQHLARLSEEMGSKVRDIEARIFREAGEPFNLNSPAQVGELLFTKLEIHKAIGMSKPRRTPTGQIKTDANILETLAPHHPIPRLLLEYRQLTKLMSTYVDSLPAMVNPETGRVHTTFNQAVAATGRLSSDNPNLQNIPIRTPEGQKVRRAFIARAPDWVLLSADYSQIELRILAHMSGEPSLIESFRAGEDIHTRTAALAHGLRPDQVTPELRTRAKAINYGLMYGMGPSRLARDTGMTPPEAKQFIDAYFRALPRVKQLLDSTLDQARVAHEVQTMFGRRRPLPDIHSTNAMLRVAAENMAVNTPIQGTAADIIKRAMIEVHRRLTESGARARLLLQVHDELVFDVPEAELAEIRVLVEEAMAGAAELTVPLAVTIGTGTSWLDAH
jgi:DNA polymerase-1